MTPTGFEQPPDSREKPQSASGRCNFQGSAVADQGDAELMHAIAAIQASPALSAEAKARAIRALAREGGD
jgi:hypothetical protein